MAVHQLLMSDQSEEPKRRKRANEDALRQRLATTIQKRMLELGMTQADVVRAVAKFRGAFDRDSMSRYTRGQSWPGPLQLAALANALQFDIREVDPGADEAVTEIAPATDSPSFSVTPDPRNPDRMRVRFDQSVSFEDAATLMRIVNEIRTRKGTSQH